MQPAPIQYRYIHLIRNGNHPIDLGKHRSDMENLWHGFKTSPGVGGRPENRERHITQLNQMLAAGNILVGIILAVRKDTGEAVGFGTFDKSQSRVFEYATAYVHPEHRGQGIFGGITEEIIFEAERYGHGVLWADLVSHELPAASLTKRGFQIAEGYASRFERRI